MRDALALNVGAAVAFHTLTAACRYLDARRRFGRDALSVMDFERLFH